MIVNVIKAYRWSIILKYDLCSMLLLFLLVDTQRHICMNPLKSKKENQQDFKKRKKKREIKTTGSHLIFD
jgi:hypothetical protein